MFVLQQKTLRNDFLKIFYGKPQFEINESSSEIMHNAKFIFKLTQTWGRIFHLSFLNVYVEVYKRVQHIYK